MTLNKEISDAIKDVRHTKRLNQTEFGKLVGVAQSQVARWENQEGKYIREETWDKLKVVIKDYISDSDEVIYLPEFLPLPEVLQSGSELINYKRKPSDKLYAYVSDDMEPTVPAGSTVLLDMLEEPLMLPKEYIPIVQMRMDLPYGCLVLVKWGDNPEYQIRRVIYKSEGDWYGMYLSRSNGHAKDAVKLNKGDDVSFLGFVKALVKQKAVSSGFLD